LSKQRPQPGGKDLGLSEEFQISLEAKLAILKSLLQRIDKLAAKDLVMKISDYICCVNLLRSSRVDWF
jgi:hypothetical protein